MFYRNNKAKFIRITFLVIVLAGYAFFFLSDKILPIVLTDAASVTKAGAASEYTSGRSCTLISAVYSEDQRLAEVVMRFQNNVHDGIDDYYYAVKLIGADVSGVAVTEVLNDNLLTVVRVENLGRFDEMTLLYAPRTAELKDVKNEQTGRIVLNKYNLTYAEIDVNKTANDYLISWLAGVAAGIEVELADEKTAREDLFTRLSALEKENAGIEKNKGYMTSAELADAVKKAESNLNLIAAAKVEIEKSDARIADLTTQIAEAKDKIQVYQGEG
jgi:hypothetical protein